jgi:spoIIIJ-associated protein
MKDPVFGGVCLEDALAAAAAALQLPPGRLRYVVLPPGSGDSAVRIAVLLDALRGPRPAPPAGDEAAPEAASLGGLLSAIAGAAGAELSVSERREGGRLVLTLGGAGATLFVRDGGRLLRAAELLLQRMADRDQEAPHVVLECAGYREERDAWLTNQARELAAEVLGSGRPREMEPLNAYERRIVHLALSETPGVRSYSVGSGADRRVTIAPGSPEPPSPEPAG